MKHINFKSLDDLFEFLKACEDGEALGASRTRALYNQVHVQQAGTGGRAGAREVSYSVEFQENVWKEAGNICGGEVRPGGAPGRAVALNDIFYSILLSSWPMSKLTEPSLVLAIPTTGEEAKDADLRETLLRAARLIPKLDGAQTRYFLRGFKFAGKDDARHLCGVEITDVDQNEFDYARFQASAPKMVKLFVPAWGRRRCHLYVEWGYRYPKAAEFYRLFDEVQAAGANSILLISKGPAVGGSDGGNWHEPLWHLVAQESYQTEYHPYAAMNMDEKAPATIQYDEARSLALPPMTLGLGMASETVGEANALERSIGLVERELEWLNARRDRVHQAVQRDYLPIYVWEQRDTPGAGPLPSGMDKFFTRTHGELSQYDYLAVMSHEGLTWHCLIGLAPVTQGASLAVPCDRLYLQETRWKEWQFPLFVRADCALSIEVDEAATADRVRALLRNEGADETQHLILAESTAANGDQARVQFILLPKGGARSVLDSLSYITAAGQGASGAASLAGALTLEAVTEHNVVVPPQVRELDAVLQQRASQLVGEIQGLWENLRVDCQKNRIEMILTQVAIHVTRKAYAQHPGTWKQFVDEVLKADGTLAELKIEALDRWAKNNAERDKTLKDLERRRTDVEALITARIAEFDKLAKEMEERFATTQVNLGKLRDSRARLDESRSRLEEVHEKLKTELREVDKEIQMLTQQRDSYVADRKRLENSGIEIQRKQHEIEEARAQVAAKTVELEQMKTRLAAEQDALEQSKIPLAEKQAQFDAAKVALEKIRQEVSQAGNLLEKDWTALNEEKLKFCGQPVPPPRKGLLSRIKSIWS